MNPFFAAKYCFACIVAFTIAIGVMGCDREQSVSSSKDNATTASPDASLPKYDEAKTVIASPNLPTRPGRIVSLAPNMTEILFALGMGDRVVGVTNYCDYPPIAKTLPKVGGFIDPDIEMILAQKPDLVVGVTSSGDPELPDKLTEAGLAYLFMEVENIEQTREAILFIGATTGAIGQAAKLNATIDQQLAAWSAELDNPPTVLVVYGHKPIVVAGPGSFAHELITRAGATNALSKGQRYTNLDAERLVALNPDIIFDAAMGGEAEGRGSPWGAYTTVNAVKNGNVIKVTDPAVMRPGPRMVKGFAELSGAIQEVAGRADK